MKSVNRLNILVISDFAAPFPGAYFKSLFHLSKEIHSIGGEVTIIFPLSLEYHDQLKNFATIIYLSSFRGRKMDFELFKMVFQIQLKNKYNVIYTNFGLASKLVGYSISILFRIVHVSHERGLSSDGLQKNPIRRIVTKTSFYFLSNLGKSKSISISNEVTRDLIDNLGVPQKKIIMIPNAVIENKTQYIERYSTAEVKNLVSNGFSIIMIGHFSRYKDHSTVVKAMKIVQEKYSDIKVILVGKNLESNKTDRKKEIEKIVLEEGLAENIFMLGMLKNPFPYIKLFDAGMLISNSEGFGNSLVEFMLMKKPVIGSAVGGITDIIREGINGIIVRPKNENDLANAIFYLKENQQERIKMGLRGFEIAKSEYSIHVWINRMISVFKEAIIE